MERQSFDSRKTSLNWIIGEAMLLFERARERASERRISNPMIQTKLSRKSFGASSQNREQREKEKRRRNFLNLITRFALSLLLRERERNVWMAH